MDMSERSSQLDQQREQRCGDADLLLCQKPAHCPVWLIGRTAVGNRKATVLHF
jgi:hypothetical protein